VEALAHGKPAWIPDVQDVERDQDGFAVETAAEPE
jgi:hypothetical protein